MSTPPATGMIFRRGRRGTLLVIALITVCGMMLALPAGGGVRSSALLPAHGISGPTPSAGALPAIIIRPPPQPNWVNVTNVSNGSSPPPSFGGSSAYDPVENGTVYFGGCREIPCFILTNETWVFANGIWTNLTNPLQAPPARDYATMDYDANMQGVLLFGGDGYQSPLGDTWLFQGGVWTNVSGWGQGPPARYGASMAFDPQPEENGSVLFGGYSSIIGYLNDTWVWHGGAGWVPLTTPSISPPQVVYATMAYDASDGYMVLFGGYEAYSAFTSTTWELYSGQWWEVSPHSAPTARDYSEMLYVPSLSGVLLFGGYDALGNERNDTWIFANGAWTEQSPSNAPPARDSFGFALDGTGTTALIIGGDNFTQAFQDTWAYEFTPQVSILPNVSTAEVGENVTFSASVAHGTAPYEIAVGFGDGAQAEITAPGPSISFQHAFAFVGSFEFSATVTDAVGAVAPSNTFPFPISGPPAVTATAAPSSGEVGLRISFSSTLVEPGTRPVSYLWEFGDGASNTTANATHAYAVAGTYLASVRVTDAHGSSATSSVSVDVAPAPTVTVAVAPSAPVVGALANFYANATGGTGSFSFAWRFGDGGGSTFPAPQHAFAKSGTFTVEVWANDSVGGSAHASVTVVVGSGAGPGPSASSSVSSAPWWFWAGIVAVAAVVAAGAFLLTRRNRRP